jgi:hypothetical protein
VYLAEDHAQFLDMIDIAIREDSAEKKRLRMQFASRNTWAARVEQFWNFLEKAGY